MDERIKKVLDSVKFHPSTAINVHNLVWKPGKCALASIGNRYGNVVISAYAYSSGTRPYVVIDCDCGMKRSVLLYEVRRGNYQTCKLCNRKVRSYHASWKGVGDMSSETYRQWVNSAKDRGLDFSVSKEYVYSVFLRQNEKCAITGVPITFGEVGNAGRTASLDRIDNLVGYVHGNLQFLHRTINYMRADMEMDQFVSICKMVTDYSGSKDTGFSGIDLASVNYRTSRMWDKKRKSVRKVDPGVDIHFGSIRGVYLESKENIDNEEISDD